MPEKRVLSYTASEIDERLGKIEDIVETLGDIETALDDIIAIQNSLIEE